MALTQQDKEELYQYIVSRGQSIASLPVGDATLTNKYLGPVIEYGSGGGSGRLVRLAVSLLQGRPAMLRNEGGFIQWSVKDSNVWETLVNASELRGPAGKNPVFRKNAGNLEYKIDGADDSTYQALVALAEITGPEGDHIVLEVRGGEVMYKQSRAADTEFKKVFTLADLRGDTGPAPVLEGGTVTTLEPSEPAAAELVENGADASGAKKYRLNLSIPKGKNGADGSGRGNVLVSSADLKVGVTYLFKPGADGSAEGEFVELTEIGTSKLAEGLKNNGLIADCHNPPSTNGLFWSNSSTLNTPPYKYGNLFQISNVDAPTFGDDWCWASQLFFGTNGRVYYNHFDNTNKWGVWTTLACTYDIPDLGNLTSNVKFTNMHATDGAKIGIQGTAAGSDYWCLAAYSTAEDQEELEIATGDNGNEPIVVRQYRGNPVSTPISQAVRTAHLLDGSGNTYFPGDVGAGGAVRSGGVDLVKTTDARLSDRRDFKFTTIPENADLNSYTTPGVFNCPSNLWVATLKNCPTTSAFSLLVLPTTSAGVLQRLTTFDVGSPLSFFRTIYNDDIGNWFRTYSTIDAPPLATATINGLMAAADKSFVDYFRGYNAVTSLANLPLNKRIILCNMSAVSPSFSFNGTPESGRDYFIIISNPTSSPITQSINIGSGSVYFGDKVITIPAGGYYEVSVLCVDGNMFYVRSGGQ